MDYSRRGERALIVYLKLHGGDIENISTQYGLEVREFEALAGGASNSNYLLYTKHMQYVLTVFESKTPLEASRIGRVLILLEKHGFPSPRLKLTTSGNEMVIFRGKPVILREFVPGEVHVSLDISMLSQVGKVIAQLHHVQVPSFLPRGYSFGWELFPQVIDYGIDPDFESWLGERYLKFRDQIPDSLPCGLIHADLFPDNLVFDDDNLQAVIDFEDVSYYPFCFDLGMGIVGMCRVGLSLDYSKTRTLIRSYQKKRTLEPGEKASLQIFLDYTATAVAYWRFWKYNIFSPVTERAQSHLEMAQFAEQISNMPQDVFIKQVFGQVVDPQAVDLEESPG